MGPINTNDPPDSAAAEAAQAHQATEEAAALAQKQGQQAAVEAAKTAPPAGAKTLVSPQRGSDKANIKLNGKAKTVPMPVTGKALHLLAGEIDGHPVVVKSGATVVPNTDEPVDSKFLEFTAEYHHH